MGSNRFMVVSEKNGIIAMNPVIDVASVVVFIVLIMYAAIKLDEAARKLRNEEERIYRERHEK